MRAAALSVLAISMAMVIRPTPPGTGVIAPARPKALLKRDVADQPRLRPAVGVKTPAPARD